LEAAAARELAGLIGGLRPDDCARIAGLAKDELSLLHFGLGLYVRNQIYDNKFIFLPESIIDANFIKLPIVNKPGVMIG